MSLENITVFEGSGVKQTKVVEVLSAFTMLRESVDETSCVAFHDRDDVAFAKRFEIWKGSRIISGVTFYTSVSNSDDLLASHYQFFPVSRDIDFLLMVAGMRMIGEQENSFFKTNYSWLVVTGNFSSPNFWSNFRQLLPIEKGGEVLDWRTSKVVTVRAAAISDRAVVFERYSGSPSDVKSVKELVQSAENRGLVIINSDAFFK